MINSQDYFPQLMQHIQTLESDDAIQALLNAANQHTADPRPVLLLAAEYAQSGRIDEAEAAYISTLQRAPDFAIARFQLGLLQYSSARPAAAFATWMPLENLEGTNPLRLFKTGLEFLAANRFDDATRILLQGIENNHDNPALNQDMRKILAEIAHAQGQAPASQKEAASEIVEVTTAEHFLVSAYRNLH